MMPPEFQPGSSDPSLPEKQSPQPREQGGERGSRSRLPGWGTSVVGPIVTHPVFLGLNGSILLLFALLTVFAKLSDSGWRVVLLFSDPFLSRPFYTGFFTNVSEVLWCIALGICLFSAGVAHSMTGRSQAFLLATALVIFALLLDDLQRLTLILRDSLGVPKVVMYGLYTLGVAAYLGRFGRWIRRESPYPLLVLMAVMFVISATTDLLPNDLQGTAAMLEDGTKLIGLVNLVMYCWWVGQAAIWKAAQARFTPARLD